MPGIPNEIYRLFRKVRDLFITVVFPNEGIFKAKFLRFVVEGAASGNFDFSELVSGDDLNEFYREFRKVRDDYVEEHYDDILGEVGIDISKDDLKRLPDWFVGFMGAKEKFLHNLADIERFVELPVDIRTGLFDTNKSLREEMLRRLIPIAFEELGIDDERVRELVGNKSEKREVYFERLFPKVIDSGGVVGLNFDEPLVWRIADEVLGGSVGD